MEGSSIRKRLALVYATLFLLTCSCAIGTAPKTGNHAELPMYSYRNPDANHYKGATVGIFLFESPEAAPDTGYVAADIVYRDLLIREWFPRVIPEFEDYAQDPVYQMRIAKERGYDLIISGRVDYYFDGSELLGSRVDQLLRVHDVETGEMIWSAKASETGSVIYDADRIFYVERGAAAPSTVALMKANSTKFCNMLAEAFGDFLPYEEAPKDIHSTEESQDPFWALWQTIGESASQAWDRVAPGN
jgi:hypothetical protein